jgi:hypothetical protein
MQDAEYGIGVWTDAQIATAIREGRRPDGSRLMPSMGFVYYGNIGSDDMAALIAYLRQLKPVPTPQD